MNNQDRGSAGNDVGDVHAASAKWDMDDNERKALLGRIKDVLLGEREEWFKELEISAPGVWRPEYSYPVERWTVFWRFSKNPVTPTFDSFELDVVGGTPSGNRLAACFSATTGAVLQADFNEPPLGKLRLKYGDGVLTKEGDWSGKATTDEWQERLGRSRLDEFLKRFCKAEGLSLDSWRSI